MAGLILGGITAGFGQLRVWNIGKHIQELKVQCAREREETRKQYGAGSLVCDPENIVPSEPELPFVGIQAQIMDAQHSLRRAKETIYIGVGLFLVLSVPWCWYFLLQRIRELSAAIAGK